MPPAEHPAPRHSAEGPLDGAAATPPPAKKRGALAWIILLALLAIALGVTGWFLYETMQRLEEAQQEIEHQRELIEKKETFSSAAQELQNTAARFDGLPFGTLVEPAHYASLIKRGWTHRWDGAALDRDTAAVRAVTAELQDALAAAETQHSTNATGTVYESLTDSLGHGFVATSLDTADAECGDDVWGCVSGDDPYTIHYDHSQTAAEPFMNDFLRTGLAYHEFAHVLQMTNPEPTEAALPAFGGDWETMADCYALTFLPGWTLQHTIWVSDFEYWEVSVGYGYTCDAAQQQVVRDWVAQLGYTHAPISQ